MLTPSTNSLIVSGLAGIICLAGIIAAHKTAAWALKYRYYFIGFAAGSLISIAFLHLIPESVSQYQMAPFAMLGGFLSLYLINTIAKPASDPVHDAHELEHQMEHACDHKLGLSPSIGYLFLLSVSLHSFLDGIIYGINFSVSNTTGVLTAAGLLLHEFPEGLMTYLVLKTCGVDSRKAFKLALFGTALTTPFGTLISLPVMDLVTPQLLGYLLAFTSGLLTYIGCTHLLPELEHSHGRSQYVGLACGLAVGLVGCWLGG